MDENGTTNGDERLRLVVMIQGLEFGGLEKVALDLVHHLPDTYDITLCCYDSLGPLRDSIDPRIQVEHLPRKPGFDAGYPGRLAAFLRERRCDVLNVHNNTAFFYGAMAKRRSGIKRLVYTEHGRTHRLSWKARLAHRLLCRRVDATIVVTPHLVDILVRDEGFPRDRVQWIPNGIDGTPFTPGHKDPEVMAELSLTPTDRVIGIVARLDPVKNHSLLLRAMRHVVAGEPAARLIIVGDGPERQRLESEARELGVAGAVTFLGQRADTPRVMSTFDVYCLCSVSEGMPLTLVEAMAAALPVVATAVGGIPTLVEPEVTGLLVPSQDEGALAQALFRALTEKDLAARMATEARRRFEAEYTLDRMVSRYVDAFEGRWRHPPTGNGSMG